MYVFERTCAHCIEYTRDAHMQETVYSLGCEDMSVVVKLEEWALVVVGLADNAGVRRVK